MKVTMTWSAYCLGCFFLLQSWTFVIGDAGVSCVFMQSCILPCSFLGDTALAITWSLQEAGGHLVHTFYYNQDQFEHQDQHFRVRTSLFKDQISRGNASLQLTGLQVQDEGRYNCYTSTNRGQEDSFIYLKVDAPVSKIHIEQVGNRITCSSEGIYPEPEITWSSNPPSPVSFSPIITVQQTEQQLYNISSSLILSDHEATDVNYSCSISTRRNTRRATLLQPASINGSTSETSVPCSTSKTSLTGFKLIWRFNHSQIILIQTRSDVPYTVSEEWRKHVKSVSESGSLMLQGLSSHEEGIYTCELSNNEETIITNSFVRTENSKRDSANDGGVIGAVVIVVVVVLGAAAAAAAVLVLYCKKRTGQQNNQQNNHRNC